MPENRNEIRSQGYAKIIAGTHPGYLRNLTENGCKVVTMASLPWKTGELFELRIVPDETSGLDTMHVQAEIRWEYQDDICFVYGMRIASFASEYDKHTYHRLAGLYSRS